MDLEQIYWNLEKRGYHLIHERSLAPQIDVSLPLLLDNLLQNPRRELINSVPVLLNNASASELEQTCDFYSCSKLINPVSYLFETVARTSGSKTGKEDYFKVYVENLSPSPAEYIIPDFKSKNTIDYLREIRTDIAQKWGVVDVNREDDFREIIAMYL